MLVMSRMRWCASCWHACTMWLCPPRWCSHTPRLPLLRSKRQLQPWWLTSGSSVTAQTRCRCPPSLRPLLHRSLRSHLTRCLKRCCAVNATWKGEGSTHAISEGQGGLLHLPSLIQEEIYRAKITTHRQEISRAYFCGFVFAGV